MNMALVNTEAFAELNSPIPHKRKSLSMKKRKQTQLETPDANSPAAHKRRSIFKSPNPVPIPYVYPGFEQDLDVDFFQTQFLKQVDHLACGFHHTNKTVRITENVGLSQYFQASQMEMTIVPTNAQAAPLQMTQILNDDIGFLDQIEDIPELSNNSCPRILDDCLPAQSERKQLTSSSLSQMLNDNADDAIIDQINITSPEALGVPPRTSSVFTQLLTEDIFLDDIPQCSQRFLHDVRDVEVVPNQNEITDPVTVYTSAKNEAAYIELQRKMLSVNEVNVDDDNFIDPDLSQAYKSTQYRRELEEIFDHCEKSICELKEPNEEESHGLENVNWTQNDFNLKTPGREIASAQTAKSNRTPLINPTNLIRQRLENRKQLMMTPNVLPRKSNAAVGSFHGMGPFFGLPLKVKSLIKDFKGISELYGIDNSQ